MLLNYSFKIVKLFSTFFLLLFLFSVQVSAQASGDDCFDARPFCSDQNYTFPNATGTTAPAGPDYGCLTNQPNPIWYYMQIENGGKISIDLKQEDLSGGDLDVDFALWGPFTDLPSGCTQVMGGGLAPLQCSYSSAAEETIGIGLPGGDQGISLPPLPPIPGAGGSTPPDAQAGEYYIVLITNFSDGGVGIDGTITFNQNNYGDPGAGSTDCSILSACLITNFTANISACTNDLYSVTGTIEVTSPPDNGDLIVEDCNGNQTVVASAPFTLTSYSYTLNNSDANGAACDVDAYFSGETSCSQTITYTAPTCTNMCYFNLLDITIEPCKGTNTFDITGTVEFTDPPSTGQLIITDCSGNSATFNAPFTSPQNFTILDIDADGVSCNITASFTDDAGCTIDIDYNNVSDCSCAARIGTFTVTTNGTQNGNDIVLCDGQEFSFVTNGDYTPPADVSNPTINYDPGIWWAVYSCPPTVGLSPAPGVDINTDPCLVTFLNIENVADINDMSFINSFPPGTFTDNIVYFVPITMYNITDGYYSATTTGTPCYAMGAPYSVQYLPEIIVNETSDCHAGTVSVTISGSSPELNGTNFTGTATNLSPPTASFDNNSVANNGTIVVSGLQDGDNYSFDIVDEFDCAVNISGVFQGVSASDFSYPKTEYCIDESNPTPVITGVSGGAFTVAPTGLSINAGTGLVNLASSTPGDYVVTYTSTGAPCNSTSTFDITVNPVPVFTLSQTDPTCGSNDGSITISGLRSSVSFDLNYNFNGTPVGVQNYSSNAAGSIVINNLGQGSYTNFTIVNNEGCSYTNPNAVNLNDIGGPTVTAPADIDICIGESVTITALNPDGATITWNNGISDGVAFTPTATGAQTYTVTATDVNNCSATDAIVVTVHGLPAVNAGQDRAICNGESTIIIATEASTYSWDNNLGAGASHTVSPIVTTTYEVTGTNNFGCVNTDQVTITVIDIPIPGFEGDNLKGCEPHFVNFTNNTGLTGVTCSWDFGDGNISNLCNGVNHTYTNSGLYDVTLTITSDNGCSGSTTIQNYIEVTPKPKASFSADPMITGTSNPVINFTNTTVNGTDFIWSFGDDSALEYSYNATHTFPDDKGGEYIVMLVASNGPNCNDTARAVIKIEEELIYYVPNTFTPDGDDFNETFKPIFTSGFDPLHYNLKIFNRWGEIVFESNDSNYGWDGTYGADSSEQVKDGVYVWKIQFKNTNYDENIEAIGHVTLLK